MLPIWTSLKFGDRNNLLQGNTLEFSKFKAFAKDKSKVAHLMTLTFNPLPDEKILDWSKLKQIADDILKCIESEK